MLTKHLDPVPRLTLSDKQFSLFTLYRIPPVYTDITETFFRIQFRYFRRSSHTQTFQNQPENASKHIKPNPNLYIKLYYFDLQIVLYKHMY